MFARTRLNVTLYVHCLSCYSFYLAVLTAQIVIIAPDATPCLTKDPLILSGYTYFLPSHSWNLWHSCKKPDLFSVSSKTEILRPQIRGSALNQMLLGLLKIKPMKFTSCSLRIYRRHSFVVRPITEVEATFVRDVTEAAVEGRTTGVVRILAIIRSDSEVDGGQTVSRSRT